jgi:hypothetical protein
MCELCDVEGSNLIVKRYSADYRLPIITSDLPQFVDNKVAVKKAFRKQRGYSRRNPR